MVEVKNLLEKDNMLNHRSIKVEGTKKFFNRKPDLKYDLETVLERLDARVNK